ncbi:hypothetical protein [Mesorhizobium sp. B1-1-8]|uniref:hypothetical protein n=1 Tax=Mesorhizobium sp. B1-1-8 TaxID=2589976 RepID=UPI001D0297D2|nr:hypothetical protein [Mesorhizobium sp. B1-1-8]UCI09720.1 hypothetical protein FJ974_12025 [Mesorhizobium sp. B1-1-8]
MDSSRLAPEIEQAPVVLDQLFDGIAPDFRGNRGARPRHVIVDAAAGQDEIDQRGHGSSLPSSKNVGDMLEP